MTKINLGSGCDIREGYINIDMFPSVGVDKVINLEKERLIKHFKQSSVDYIFTSHFLEHINNSEEVFLDCLVILKDKGVFEIILPHCTRVKNYTILHKRYFNSNSFNEYIEGYKDTNSLQTGKYGTKLKLLSKELVWLHRPKNGFLKGLNKFVNGIVNSSPILQNLMENYFSYYVGGLAEFKLIFEVIKNE